MKDDIKAPFVEVEHVGADFEQEQSYNQKSEAKPQEETKDMPYDRQTKREYQLQRMQPQSAFDKLEVAGSRVREGVARVKGRIVAAVQATFDRIRGIVHRAKARFSKAIPRTKKQVHDVMSEAVTRAKQLTSIESIKTTLNEIKQHIQDGKVSKYFSSRTVFVKLLDPLTKRYNQLIRKLRGQKAAAAKKPESPLWLELTGMTKAEIQGKAAEEMRFIMINTSFNSKKA